MVVHGSRILFNLLSNSSFYFSSHRASLSLSSHRASLSPSYRQAPTVSRGQPLEGASQRQEGFSQTATKGTRPTQSTNVGIPPGAVSPAMCRRSSGHAILCSQGKWGRGGQPIVFTLGPLRPVRGCVEPSITLGTSGCGRDILLFSSLHGPWFGITVRGTPFGTSESSVRAQRAV